MQVKLYPKKFKSKANLFIKNNCPLLPKLDFITDNVVVLFLYCVSGAIKGLIINTLHAYCLVTCIFLLG